MKEIWIATSNEGKIQEFTNLLSKHNIEVKGLFDYDKNLDIEENGVTFEENALIKARFLANLIKKPVIADDSGLQISQLDNFPGINSRRWAYPETDFEKMCEMIIEKCKDLTDRSACFTSAIAYVDPIKNIEKVFIFNEKGLIYDKLEGKSGFGYDQIFYLPDLNKTYAQLTLSEKNQISQRAKAINELFALLNTI